MSGFWVAVALLPQLLLSLYLSARVVDVGVGAANGPQQQFVLTEMTDSGNTPGDEYGDSVATLGGFAVIGSPYASTSTLTQNGYASTYHRDVHSRVWVQDQQLNLWNAASSDQFSTSVAMFRPLRGALLAILSSAPQKQNFYPGDGIVMVFMQHAGNISAWDNSSLLVMPDPLGGDRYVKIFPLAHHLLFFSYQIFSNLSI